MSKVRFLILDSYLTPDFQLKIFDVDPYNLLKNAELSIIYQIS